MRSQEASSLIPDSQLLKSGEFAQLCGTTKDTLRHYRQIGLLEPVSISASGYALYSPLQVGDFLLIAALQNAGSSLEAIKSYLDEPQADRLDAALESHIATLKEQRRALLARQRFLEGTLTRRRSLASWAACEEGWRVTELDEEFFAEVDMSELFAGDAADSSVGRELTEGLVEEGLALFAQGFMGEMQGCYRVGLDALKEGVPEQDFRLCMALAASQRRKADCIRPKGLYFQRLRTVTVNALLADSAQMFEAYRALYSEALDRGFEPIGDLYEQELSLYTGDFAAQIHTELSIEIAPMPETTRG